MKKYILRLVAMSTLFYSFHILSSQESQAEQITSHLPQSLTELYKRLDKSCKLQQRLEGRFDVLLGPVAHQKVTQALDINSYQQKFILQKIKIIEELHSSLAENETLNVILHGNRAMLFTFIENSETYKIIFF
ncbi:MAG: hypothetical protein P4L31_08375 [Candidatus Babeliales bacterium]|nr:hypothetical protein [Candidatus Babeliales bacterium]